MSEIHNDNPETKSSAPEVSQPEPAKASEGDKEKLTPQENDAAKASREGSEQSNPSESPEHPKLEASNGENRDTPNGDGHASEHNEHGKLTPEQPKEQNPEQPKEQNQEQPKEQNPEQPKEQNPEQPKEQNPEQPKDQNPEQPKEQNPEQPKDQNPEQPKEQNPEQPKDQNPEQPKEQNPEQPKDQNPEQPKEQNPEQPKDQNPEQPKEQNPEQPKEQNPEQPKENELSPYAKGKLDNFPNDAPEEIKPAYERACAAEPKITKDMQDITSNSPGAHLEGLDYRLKDGDSFARKANSVSENKGIPLEDAANNMHDLNRYTQVSDGDHLVDNANNTLAGLKDKGYTINDVNSTWGDDGAYKGINCKLTSPDGQPCELQFHTPESLDTKEPMHKLYEAQRQLPEGSPEWNAYEDQMRNMSSSLTPPKNIDNLRTNYD